MYAGMILLSHGALLFFFFYKSNSVKLIVTDVIDLKNFK